MKKEILQEIGLTNNETEVYLTLLRTGISTVNKIAEKSGLHRQVVYDALDRLLEKGFVSFVIKKNKKNFQPIPPNKILDYLKDKEDKFRSLLPDLLKITQTIGDDTTVEVFKGKDVVRTIYRDIIQESKKKGGEILITGTEEKKFMEEDKIALDQHLNRLRTLKCTERLLIKEGDTTFVEGPQTQYRWIAEEHFNPTPIFVYNDKLTIMIWGNPNYAIIIKNRNLADSYRKQFNLLWKISKKIT